MILTSIIKLPLKNNLGLKIGFKKLIKILNSIKDGDDNFMMFLMFANESKGFIHWLQNHLLACPMKQMFGIDCPGCGLQRSIIALMQGDLMASFKLYPATIPFLFVIIFSIIHLKFDFKSGAQIIKISVAFVAIIIIINYIYKIFTHQLI